MPSVPVGVAERDEHTSVANRENATFAADNLVNDAVRLADELAEPFGIRWNFEKAFTRNNRTGEGEIGKSLDVREYLVVPVRSCFFRLCFFDVEENVFKERQGMVRQASLAELVE